MNWLFRKPGPSGFSYSSTAEEVTEGIDASGLTAVVTGSSLNSISVEFIYFLLSQKAIDLIIKCPNFCGFRADAHLLFT
jgi:acyl CoA:acetate/3-ketoacid CoA transferase alpha subunit